MPSSFVDSVPSIVKLMIEVAPSKVIDVGPGWGKYGLMAREYCNPSIVDCIEVSQGRIFTQDIIYDNIIESDVRNVDQKVWSNYDLVLIIDVIEHMSIIEGQKLVNEILSQGASIIISTPKIWEAQEDEKNPYEKHVSLWDWTMFPEPALDSSTIDSLIFLLRP
jgi:hypothetical protein